EGVHTFTVRATDAAGNAGSASRGWTIDTTPPSVSVTSGPADPTNATSASFAFTASDGQVQCRIDGGSFASCSSPASFTGLGEGVHTFTVRATDAARNAGSASR